MLNGGLRLAAIGALLSSAATYVSDTLKWRAAHEAELKTPEGWLSVTGLVWLHAGINPVPGGAVRLTASKAVYRTASGSDIVLKPDTSGAGTVVKSGSVSMTLIQRGDRLGIRLRDPASVARRDFTGCKWFPVEEALDVKAHWVPYPAPKQIAILNIIGLTSEEPSPGYAEFTLASQKLRLEPIAEDDHLFFIFKDRTSGHSTYGAGRFLYAAAPRNGIVDLDFNRAENPPCAFTPYATCPLPPRQNVLPVAIEAGEKKYGIH